MALASIPAVVLGSIAFTVFWMLAVFPAVAFLPVGRTAGSLLGAMLMVVFQVVSPEQAYASIDLPILGLLFGTMVVSIYLERAQMFKYLGRLLSWKSKGGPDLLCRVCFVSALASALFTNDTTCIVLTEFVLKLAKQHKLPAKPFLLALASSANIGSSATPIGNPQNLVIAVESKISFTKFFLGIFPAMLIGVVINVVILLGMFWKQLSSKESEEQKMEVEVTEMEVNSHTFVPARMSHPPPLDSQEMNDVEKNDPRKDGSRQGCAQVSDMKRFLTKKEVFLKGSVYFVSIGMLIALLMGLNMSWTALTAALILVVIDFKDAGPCLDKSAAAVSPKYEARSWLLLAFVSTVAGNLSLLGSAANLIVCEQARRSELHKYTLSFWEHIVFGLPSTLVVTIAGLPLIRA
ncbi:hypothetical protein BHE74_00048803 [Ensete ventricosum]|nr:hypothetical protein BHE74_00048803 [Ensete ventricosum]RZR77343.1 hypothetical protein BHM03_00002384 [Ensete ventricosum]